MMQRLYDRHLEWKCGLAQRDNQLAQAVNYIDTHLLLPEHISGVGGNSLRLKAEIKDGISNEQLHRMGNVRLFCVHSEGHLWPAFTMCNSCRDPAPSRKN